jgi:hypothetical protein
MTIDIETRAHILKDKIARDGWTSHIQVDDGAITQLASLLEKHYEEGDGLKTWDGMIRFYVFGYLTGQLIQKWKDQGLVLTKEEEESGEFDEHFDDGQPDEQKEWEDFEGEDLPEVKE